MAIPKQVLAKLVGTLALLLALQKAVATASIPPAAEPQHAAANCSDPRFVRGYILDLYECWKLGRSGKSSVTTEEKCKCLAATGDELPSTHIKNANSISVIPGKGESRQVKVLA